MKVISVNNHVQRDINCVAFNIPVRLFHQLSNDVVQTGLTKHVVARVCASAKVETDWVSTQAGNHLNETDWQCKCTIRHQIVLS